MDASERRRTGDSQHHTPKATSATLNMIKPSCRSWEISPLTRRAGGKTS
jgi:hypothetical protein